MSLIEQLEEEYDFHIICAKKHMTHANCVKKILKEIHRKDEKDEKHEISYEEKKKKARLYYTTHRSELRRKAREKYAANIEESRRKAREYYAANRKYIRIRETKRYKEGYGEQNKINRNKKHLIRDKSHEICKKVTADELIFRLDD